MLPPPGIVIMNNTIKYEIYIKIYLTMIYDIILIINYEKTIFYIDV